MDHVGDGVRAVRCGGAPSRPVPFGNGYRAAMSRQLDPATTVVDPSAFVARGAVVVGDVHLHEDASVWFGAVLRGDTERIDVGARSNVQDGAVVHADPGFPARIGADCTIGHRAVVHGATVGDGSLVGIGAILLNGAVVPPRCLVAAGALVPPGRVYAEGMLLMGSPARAVRALTDAQLADLAYGAEHYVDQARAFRDAGWDERPAGSSTP